MNNLLKLLKESGNEMTETTPLPLKKSFVQKIFGLNLTLHAREARGVAEKQWASIAEAHCEVGKKPLCNVLVSIYYSGFTHFTQNF